MASYTWLYFNNKPILLTHDKVENKSLIRDFEGNVINIPARLVVKHINEQFLEDVVRYAEKFCVSKEKDPTKKLYEQRNIAETFTFFILRSLSSYLEDGTPYVFNEGDVVDVDISKNNSLIVNRYVETEEYPVEEENQGLSKDDYKDLLTEAGFHAKSAYSKSFMEDSYEILLQDEGQKLIDEGTLTVIDVEKLQKFCRDYSLTKLEPLSAKPDTKKSKTTKKMKEPKMEEKVEELKMEEVKVEIEETVDDNQPVDIEVEVVEGPTTEEPNNETPVEYSLDNYLQFMVSFKEVGFRWDPDKLSVIAQQTPPLKGIFMGLLDLKYEKDLLPYLKQCFQDNEEAANSIYQGTDTMPSLVTVLCNEGALTLC